MILELDIGNTRTKWRVVDGIGTVIARGVAEHLQQLLDDTVGALHMERVRIACVRPGDYLEKLVRELELHRRLPVAIARVLRHWQGVKVAYPDLSKLGVDRWLAMLAAYRQSGKAVIVVDCGTAMTVDLLNDIGDHLGGYIVPGLSLASAALPGATAIRLEGVPHWGTEPGNCTEEAIYHGVMVMLTGLLEKVVAHQSLGVADGKVPVIYLTGGDAPLIRRFLNLERVEIHDSPELVFDGLAVALP